MAAVVGRTVLAACLLALAGGTGCGGDPYAIGGSLTAVVDLDYDYASFEVSGDSMSVRFLKARGAGEDTVLKVSVFTGGLVVEPGVPIDLAEPSPFTGQRGVVTRQVFQDPRELLPELQRGGFLLQGDPFEVDTVRGEFACTFLQGADFGSGRAVNGKFLAEVQR